MGVVTCVHTFVHNIVETWQKTCETPLHATSEYSNWLGMSTGEDEDNSGKFAELQDLIEEIASTTKHTDKAKVIGVL